MTAIVLPIGSAVLAGSRSLRVLGGSVAVLLPAGTFVYLFLFKMMSFMQSRLGPMEAGPYGSMQLFAEVGKWLQKEDIVPASGPTSGSSSWRRSSSLVSTFLLVVVVPFGPDACFANLDAGIFFVLAVRRSPCSASSSPAGRRPTSTRCSAACVPPASSSPTSCRWCSRSSAS